MESFEDLEAWKVGMDLVEGVYELTREFPKEEMFGLTAQLRRASVSIVANIAEGFCRHTFADKANKYTIARGECGEVKTLILVAVRLTLVSEQRSRNALALVERVGRLLSGLIRSSKAQYSNLQYSNTPE